MFTEDIWIIRPMFCSKRLLPAFHSLDQKGGCWGQHIRPTTCHTLCLKTKKQWRWFSRFPMEKTNKLCPHYPSTPPGCAHHPHWARPQEQDASSHWQRSQGCERTSYPGQPTNKTTRRSGLNQTSLQTRTVNIGAASTELTFHVVLVWIPLAGR